MLAVFHALGARAAAQDLRQSAGGGEVSVAVEALAQLEHHTAGLGRWGGGPPWTWLEWLPWVGDALDATTTLAASVDTVVTPLAPILADIADRGSGELADTAALLAERSPALVEIGRDALRVAPDVAGIRVEDLAWPWRDPIAQTRQEYLDVTTAATAVAAGSLLIPGLLGTEEPSSWVLVAAQPAEARGSGAGFFGALAIMEAAAGELALAEVRPNDEVFDVPADLAVLPPEFAELWGPSAAYIWGHNQTRNYPSAAALLRQTSAATGTDPEYIVAIDPRVVAAILELTGPVTAAGVTIDAASAEDYLTRGIYRQFPEGGAKDTAASELMAAAFAALQTTAVAPADLAQALAGPVAEQRLVAWAADPAEQEVVAWTPIAGALPEDDWTLTAAINNVAGNKLDAYLDTDVVLSLSGSCPGTTEGEIAMTLTYTGIPPDLPDYVVRGVRGPDVYAGTRLLVHVYGPPSADLTAMTIDGRPALPQRGTELGRPVWGTPLDLQPGVRRTVEVAFAAPAGDAPPGFVPQPMVRDTEVVVSDDRDC